jgi:hypothetical protein
MAADATTRFRNVPGRPTLPPGTNATAGCRDNTLAEGSPIEG